MPAASAPSLPADPACGAGAAPGTDANSVASVLALIGGGAPAAGQAFADLLAAGADVPAPGAASAPAVSPGVGNAVLPADSDPAADSVPAWLPAGGAALWRSLKGAFRKEAPADPSLSGDSAPAPSRSAAPSGAGDDALAAAQMAALLAPCAPLPPPAAAPAPDSAQGADGSAPAAVSSSAQLLAFSPPAAATSRPWGDPRRLQVSAAVPAGGQDASAPSGPASAAPRSAGDATSADADSPLSAFSEALSGSAQADDGSTGTPAQGGVACPQDARRVGDNAFPLASGSAAGDASGISFALPSPAHAARSAPEISPPAAPVASAADAAQAASSAGASSPAPLSAVPVPRAAARITTKASAAGTASAAGVEKFAEGARSSVAPIASASSGSEKNSLDAGGKQLADQDQALGIAGAKPLPAMPFPAPSTLQTPAHAASVEAPSSAAALATGAGASAAPVATAQQAVETVARLVDAQASRSQASVSSVNLSFKVGGEDLAVRVEWKGGEVRAQFSTDSSELRGALADQWQSMTAASGTRNFHFADPVFTAASGHELASGSGGRGQDPQAALSGQPGFGRQGGRQPSADSSPAPASSRTPTAAAAPASRGRLRTFA